MRRLFEFPFYVSRHRADAEEPTGCRFGVHLTELLAFPFEYLGAPDTFLVDLMALAAQKGAALFVHEDTIHP